MEYRKINRREFCKTSISTAAAIGIPFHFAGCSDHEPVLPSSDLPPSQGITAQVSTILGDNLDSMTRDAIDNLGGMHTIIDPGETVFIKPNLVSFPWAKDNNCFHNGECTKTEIIIAVTEECLKAGARKVTIGDGSQMPSFDWQYALTLDGSTNLVNEAQRLSSLYDGTVELACLETDSPDWVDLPSSTSLHTIAVSGLVANADKVISIPVAKTHSWAQVTLALKNFIGVTPISRYAQWHSSYWNRDAFDHTNPQAIAQVYLDIVKGVQPNLSIIDFSIGIEADGPTLSSGGKTIDMKKHLGSWAIVASTDIMAADATAVRIMNHDTSRVQQLTMGFDMGLGEIRDQSIEILGEKLDNLQVGWRSAILKG